VSWRERVAEANGSAVRDGRDTCESAVGRPVLHLYLRSKFFLGEHDLMDKRWIYEEAIRMPFILHYPDPVQTGSSNDLLINNTDFASTILAIAGVLTAAYMQGRSFAGALRGEPRPNDWLTAPYYRYWTHMAHRLRVAVHFGICTDRCKPIYFYGRPPSGGQPTPVALELYDLRNDPFGKRNQFANPKYAATLADLKRKLRQVRRDLSETDKDYPKIQAMIDARLGTAS
jgi:arylsulfatase A-like enzyme